MGACGHGDQSNLVFLLGAVLGSALFATAATGDLYFNSAEPVCNSNDPSILWCDDFEDGSWIQTCEAPNSSCCTGNSLCQANGAGESNPNNDGWKGNGYTSWPDPAGADWARCGGLGVSGTNCAATSGVLVPDPVGVRMMGRKHFAPNRSEHREVYIRWYVRQLPGFIMGHEKMMTLENDRTGYRPAILTKNNRSGCLAVSNKSQGGVNLSQNLGNQLCIQNNRWYYIEMRVKLDTNGSDGIYELWLDDCGTDGRGCAGIPGTKRASHTNVNWAGAGQSFDTTWLENWSNGPGSSGEQFYDQMVAATRRIGPVGTNIGAPPSQPGPAAPVLLD